MPLIEPGIYQHYKGNRYRVLGVAKHSETLEEMVVYTALYDNPESELWVRPINLFQGQVRCQGKLQPRFQKVT